MMVFDFFGFLLPLNGEWVDLSFTIRSMFGCTQCEISCWQEMQMNQRSPAQPACDLPRFALFVTPRGGAMGYSTASRLLGRMGSNPLAVFKYLTHPRCRC
jgi:hypothetical protein